MPIQGFAKNRLWRFGKQSVHGTAVSVTRALPFKGVLEVNPNWTDSADVDLGSIDVMLDPYRLQTDVTASLTGELYYNDIPLLMAASVRGGVSAVTSSSTYQWTHQSLSTTATTLDEFTTEWSDDVTTDGFKARDGIVESLELSFDESLGPWMQSTSWRYGAVEAQVTPTTGLLVGSNLPRVMGADTSLYIDSTAAGIGGTKISDALHRATITITNSIDQKRFANGNSSRFAIAGYGLTSREIKASFTFAKTSAIVGSTTETSRWLSEDPVNRYLKVNVTSSQFVAGSIPYSWDLYLSGTWRTRTDEEVGGNAVVTLELTGRYDATLGYALKSYVVNGRATLP